MTTTKVVETSVTFNNNSPIQDYVHPYDQTQPTFQPYWVQTFSQKFVAVHFPAYYLVHINLYTQHFEI